MKHYKLTLAERETIIRTSDAEEGWVVYSDSPAMIRQLQALVKRTGGWRIQPRPPPATAVCCPK